MDASYLQQYPLFQAMVNPAELHYIVDSLDESRGRLEEAIQEVSISASVPHGIMGEGPTCSVAVAFCKQQINQCLHERSSVSDHYLQLYHWESKLATLVLKGLVGPCRA
jgi:hypothetical protein